jgi:hypothetical protein
MLRYWLWHVTDKGTDSRSGSNTLRLQEQAPTRGQGAEPGQVKFGEPYENTRKLSKFDYGEDLVVVPVEIEIDSMLYNLIVGDILSHFDVGHGMRFEEWVNICFKERMEQIVTDPKEFGKIVLNQIRRNNCLPEVDLEEEKK